MLAFNVVLNNLKSSINKYAIRSLASSRRRVNNQRKVQEEYEEDSPLEDIQDADYVDLSKIEPSSKEMYSNVELIREQEKYLIVKQKYFKIKKPNFLSWNEKMKIRTLYNKDPEEWSIDTLAESFPALPDTIFKIVKAKWMKNNNKITAHDESVEKNWKEFRKGRLELPDDLADHLKNFTSRESNTLHLLESDLINVTPPPLEPPPNSFEAIIVNYEKLKPKAVEESPKKLLEVANNVKKKAFIDSKANDLSNSLFKKKREPIYTVPGFD